MGKINIVSGLVAIALSCVAVSEAQAEPAPLSCNMQMMLTGMAALRRDQGVARQDTEIGKNKDSELTKKEVKTILDRVYIEGKNQTPDQIKDDVYRKCKNGH